MSFHSESAPRSAASAGPNASVGGIESTPLASSPRARRLGLIASFATWGLFFCLLWPRMLFEKSDGIYSGSHTVWADWSHHFAFANVFAYRPVAGWFTNHPLFIGKSLDYPFVADAITGLLMRAGVDRTMAFVLPSVVTTLILIGLLYSFYFLLLRQPGRSLLAMTLFFTNGGLGFLFFVRDLVEARSLSVLSFPPRGYSLLREYDIAWANIVSTQILPQRGTLLGLALGLAVLVPIVRADRTRFAGTSFPMLCALGLLAGLLLVTYAHAYLVLVILCGLLLLYNLKCYKPWFTFAGAAAASSLVIFVLFYSNTAIQSFIGWYPGWLTNAAEHREISLVWFLLLNWGVFLPLAAISFFQFGYYKEPLVLGGVILFVLCFLVRFMPYPWDNNKILTWAHLLLCVPVAHLLAYLWERPRWLPRATAVVLVILATATGALELWRQTNTDRLAVRMFSAEEIELADAFRELSSPADLVLSSDHHHHWVPSLAGRRVLLGYRGWLGAWGIDYKAVERDVRTMLAAEPGTVDLMREYGVDYVVIGPTERSRYAADEAYWLSNFELVLESDSHKVFVIERHNELEKQAPPKTTAKSEADSEV
jgi:hypothetical protein